MKKIEDLGISPWPWRKEFCEFHDEESPFEIVVGDNVSSLDGQFSENDANLIAAAPKLYYALREAVIELCHDCPNCGGYPKYGCKKPDCECFPAERRAVLAKAEGKEVAK